MFQELRQGSTDILSEESAIFQKYREKRIVLYGLGTETKRVLEVFGSSFKVIGLLDGVRESGELYGKPILSLQQVLMEGVELIIVVARPGSCRVIVKKIGKVCRDKGILLMDVRGKDLLENRQVAYAFCGRMDRTRSELSRKIKEADVISFDLFDTLVMREVLQYTDLFELIDVVLREKGVLIHDFAVRRLAAEKKLAVYGSPTLETIYKCVLSEEENSRITSAELAELEWEMDLSMMIPRRAVCEIFRNCVRSGKEVFIVTDTYYHIKQIKKILQRCCLEGETGIFVSCEHNMGKMQGLLEKLRARGGNKKYLHIGDDLTADIEMAQKAGMDTFHIFSAEELLNELGFMGMESYMDTLVGRIKIGLFAARIFQDPFWVEEESKKVRINETSDLGYLLCAPIIVDFVLWLQKVVNRETLSNIWFCARDGYLIQRMYEMLEPYRETRYFLTSRMAAVEAGVEKEEDILYVDSMKFSGTIGENLSVRFGLNADEISGMNVDEQGLLGYKEAILKHADVRRRGYKAYIKSLNIKAGKIAFFDFVAKGTVQMYIQKLVDNHLRGLYFIQLEPEFMSDKGLDIASFYSQEDCGGSIAFEDYYILETILTAHHPCVRGFDEWGKVVYAEETRTEREINCFLRVQEGIMEYFQRYIDIVPKSIRKPVRELDEVILGLIHRIKVENEDFRSLIVEDPFFNRRTSLEDLL